mgnify:CR=1 FL=1
MQENYLRKLLRKTDSLEREAFIDLEWGCFNKAASALYFALRYMATILLELRGAPYPRRDDKFANTIKAQGVPEVAQALRRLYDLRKIADYSDNDVKRQEIDGVMSFYQKAKNVLQNAIRKELSKKRISKAY